jgi:hypothetical protein
VPEPPDSLRGAAERIVAALETPQDAPAAIGWPADLHVTERVVVPGVVRAMRATEARFAPLQLGPVMDGDGERRATFRLLGARGKVDLALVMDSETGRLDSVSLVPVRQVSPDPG